MQSQPSVVCGQFDHGTVRPLAFGAVGARRRARCREVIRFGVLRVIRVLVRFGHWHSLVANREEQEWLTRRVSAAA
jgi:hypothetical protein